MAIRRAKCCGNCAHAELLEKDKSNSERFKLLCMVNSNATVDGLSVCDVFEHNQQEVD